MCFNEIKVFATINFHILIILFYHSILLLNKIYISHIARIKRNKLFYLQEDNYAILSLHSWVSLVSIQFL